ncbi:MAG: dihydrofolate reductase family protein [Succinivibrio sp.]
MDMTVQRVTCLMESSLDGRLDESRWSVLYDRDGEGDPDVYYQTKAKINPEISLLGKETIIMHHCSDQFTCNTHTKIEDPRPFLGIRENAQLTAVFDSAGTIAYKNNEIWGTTLLVVLGEDTASQEYLDYLKEREISYTFAGSDGHDLKKALKSIYSDFGIKNVLLCGGGILNGDFLSQGLIDELYLVLYPGIDGLSGVNSIFEYKGAPGEKPCRGQTLELISCNVERAGVVVLRYKFHFYSDN